MYVIKGIPEFRKNRNPNSDFQLERFSGFPSLFSAKNFRNSELGIGIPDSGRPRNRNPKSEFPTKYPSGSCLKGGLACLLRFDFSWLLAVFPECSLLGSPLSFCFSRSVPFWTHGWGVSGLSVVLERSLNANAHLLTSNITHI
jgi:hypothetical protein